MRNIDKLTIENMDVFFPLTQKKDLITRISKEYLNGRLLDLGCGTMPYKNIILENSNVVEYTGVDIENPIYQTHNKPDFFGDGIKIPLDNASFNSAILIEVLEHIPNPNNTLKELNRVLTIDANLLITVPFLWTLHDVPNDEYRYTPFALKRMLLENGFEIVKLESFNNWHGSMASMLALYSRRAISKRNRNLISRVTLPIVKYLMKKDLKSDKSIFKEGQMITGLWCVAKKIKNE